MADTAAPAGSCTVRPGVPARPTSLAAAWTGITAVLTVAAMAVAVVLAPRGHVRPGAGLTWLLFVGSAMHVASTGWLFALPSVRRCAARHPRRYLVAPCALVAVGATAAALLDARAVTWMLLGFFAWQFFHFAKQNVGIASLAAASHGAGPLRPAGRRAIVGAGVAGIVALVSRPALLQVRAPSQPGWLFNGAELAFVAAVAIGLVSVVRAGGHARRVGFLCAYLPALCFSLPIFVCSSPYAAIGGMTIAHGLQYLVLVGVVAAGPRGTSARRLRIWSLASVAIAGGVALRVASHLHSAPSAALRAVFGAYLGVTAAHFVVDAGLWRRRDRLSRAFLDAAIPDLVSPRGQTVRSGGR